MFSYLSIANDDLFGSQQVEEEGDEDSPLSKGSGLFSKSRGGGGDLFSDDDEGELEQSIMSTTGTSSKVITCTCCTCR